MTIPEKTLIELMRELPPALHGEVRDFVEFLLEKQRRGKANGWPEGLAYGWIDHRPDVRATSAGRA